MFKHHTLQLGEMAWKLICQRRKKQIWEVAMRKIKSYNEEITFSYRKTQKAFDIVT